MDPFVISIIVVVVTYITTIYALLRGNTTTEQTGSVTVLPQQPVQAKMTEVQQQAKENKDSQIVSHETVEKFTQTDDSEAFYTLYEHTQAQRQETLLLEEQLDRTLQQFSRSLGDIIEHHDRNFQYLTHQLRSEFNAYMQFALSNAVTCVIPIPPPLRFNTPGSSNFPPIPDFCTGYNHIFIGEFDKIEVEIQRNITNREAQGMQPPEKQRPWLQHPFGRRTRSQEQFARRHAQHEEHLKCKREEQSHQLLVSPAVQAAITPIPLHRPTKEDTDLVAIKRKRSDRVSNQATTITEVDDTQNSDDNILPQPSSSTETQTETAVKRPLYYQEPYFFPDVPPLPSFGRGTHRILSYIQQQTILDTWRRIFGNNRLHSIDTHIYQPM